MNQDDYGACCVCLKGGPDVQNFIMLTRRAPEPEAGSWGCFTCGLPTEGAVAVLCGGCFPGVGKPLPKILWVIAGYAEARRRVGIDELEPEGSFDHDYSKHRELAEHDHFGRVEPENGHMIV